MQGDREARNIATTLGREVRTSRRRLRWTQRELGQRVGLEQSRISEIERGFATGTPLIVWVRLGMVLGRPVGMAFARDLRPQPNDAGHLDAQEALLRICARTTRTGRFELATRPADPLRSAGLALRDDVARELSILENLEPLRRCGRRRPVDRPQGGGGRAPGDPHRARTAIPRSVVLGAGRQRREPGARREISRGPPRAVSRVVVGVGPGAHRRDARATPAGPRVDRPADRPALGRAASRAGVVAVGPLSAAHGSHRYGGHGSLRPPCGA